MFIKFIHCQIKFESSARASRHALKTDPKRAIRVSISASFVLTLAWNHCEIANFQVSGEFWHARSTQVVSCRHAPGSVTASRTLLRKFAAPDWIPIQQHHLQTSCKRKTQGLRHSAQHSHCRFRFFFGC